MHWIIQCRIYLKSIPCYLDDYYKIKQYQWECTAEKGLLDTPSMTSLNNCLYNYNKLLYLNWKWIINLFLSFVIQINKYKLIIYKAV